MNHPPPDDRLDLTADLAFQQAENDAIARHPGFIARCEDAAREQRPAPPAPRAYRRAIETAHALLPRTCGACSACCWTYEVPEFGKPARCWCPKLDAGRCTVYPTRPTACLEFACDWLRGRLPEWASPLATGLVSRLVPVQALSQIYLSPLPVIAELSETIAGAATAEPGRSLVALLQRDGFTVRATTVDGAFELLRRDEGAIRYDPRALPSWLFERRGTGFALGARPEVLVQAAPRFDGDGLDDWFAAHVEAAGDDPRPLEIVRDELAAQIATEFVARLSGLDGLDARGRDAVVAAARGVAEGFLDGLLGADED